MMIICALRFVPDQQKRELPIDKNIPSWRLEPYSTSGVGNSWQLARLPLVAVEVIVHGTSKSNELNSFLLLLSGARSEMLSCTQQKLTKPGIFSI